jgi:hypothetical protein
VVRIGWVALPFTAGPALADALDGCSTPVRTVASVALWAGWSSGMIASFVALPASLTAMRLLAPAAVAAVVAAAVDGHTSPLAAGWTALVLVWVFSPPLGAWCVNGPAYPNERRYLLRAPGALLAGPLALAWALAVAGAAAGPLLLAAHQWVLGGVLLAVGWPVAALAVRAVHNLARRWAVFVPAGLVLHDPMTLMDPVLFRRQMVAVLQPAGVEGDAVDLTQAAPGLALEMQLAEPVTLSLMKPGQRAGESRSTSRVLFTPTRPGAVLEDARTRRFTVG